MYLKVQPSVELYYIKMAEGYTFLDMYLGRRYLVQPSAELYKNGRRLHFSRYVLGYGRPGQNQYIPPIPAIEIGILIPAIKKKASGCIKMCSLRVRQEYTKRDTKFSG